RERRVHFLRAVAQAPQSAFTDGSLARGLGVGRVIRRAYVVKLHVEDERRIPSTCSRNSRGRLRRLSFGYFEEPAEHRIHGEKCRRHSAAGAQEVATAEPQSRR